MARQRWREMSSKRQTAVLCLASVQLSLAATAWLDLARHPAEEINGSKGKWAAIIAISFVGPGAYFRRGRVRTHA
jgi:hypothetical protein